MNTVTLKLSTLIKENIRRFRNVIWAVLYYGKDRICPVCGKSSRKFRQFGTPSRKDAQCVYCGAVERHRVLWLFLQKKTNIFDKKPKKILHIAPERCFESRFKQLINSDYLTADLFNPRAMVKMDITDIKYPENSFDVILCSHVLEHVENDKQAMKEFYRVLKTGGWAALIVPIINNETFEDPLIINPAERFKVFGQEDHIRCYGPDIIERLREVGFNVNLFKVNDLIDEKNIRLMGLSTASSDRAIIFYCTK